MRKFITRSAAAVAVAAAVVGTSPVVNAQGSQTMRFRSLNRIETFTAIAMPGIVRVQLRGDRVNVSDVNIYVYDDHGVLLSGEGWTLDDDSATWVSAYAGRVTIQVVINRPSGDEYILEMWGGLLLEHVTSSRDPIHSGARESDRFDSPDARE
jgi:hypothetical protein